MQRAERGHDLLGGLARAVHDLGVPVRAARCRSRRAKPRSVDLLAEIGRLPGNPGSRHRDLASSRNASIWRARGCSPSRFRPNGVAWWMSWSSPRSARVCRLWPDSGGLLRWGRLQCGPRRRRSAHWAPPTSPPSPPSPRPSRRRRSPPPGSSAPTWASPTTRPATNEMAVAGYRENGPTRCYFCKSELLDRPSGLAAELGFDAMATGTNALGRRGRLPARHAGGGRARRAHPLAECGLDKAAVRAFARHWDLPTWDKPATPCLSSRIAYGVGDHAAPAGPGRAGRGGRPQAARRRPRSAGPRPRRRRAAGGRRAPGGGGQGGRRRARRDRHGRVRRRRLTVEPFRSGAMNELLPDRRKWRTLRPVRTPAKRSDGAAARADGSTPTCGATRRPWPAATRRRR